MSKKHINFLLSNSYLIVLVLSSVLLPLFCLNSYDYKVDSVCRLINNYNEKNYYTGFVSPVLKVKALHFENDKEKLYPDPFNTFYYNLLVNGSRLLIDDECSDGDSAIQLLTQNTFSIQEQESKTDGGYRLDYGLYHSYFSNSDLGLNNCYTPRFDCDSFILISDSYADKIVEKNNIPGSTRQEKYKNLIISEEYSKIFLNINEATYSFSINNILYSSLKQGNRTSKLYGYFGMTSITSKPGKNSATSFEVDLKVDPFGNKEIIKDFQSFGYKGENCEYHLYSYNYSNKCYYENVEISKYLNNLNDNKTCDYLFVIFSILYCCVLFVCLFFFNAPISDTLSATLLILTVAPFIVYGIACTWMSVYSFISLPFIIQIIFIFYVKGKEFINYAKARTCIFKKGIKYVEIKI